MLQYLESPESNVEIVINAEYAKVGLFINKHHIYDSLY